MPAHELISHVWDLRVHVTVPHVLAAVGVGGFLFHLVTRSRESLLIAAVATLYAVPLLLG